MKMVYSNEMNAEKAKLWLIRSAVAFSSSSIQVIPISGLLTMIVTLPGP